MTETEVESTGAVYKKGNGRHYDLWRMASTLITISLNTVVAKIMSSNKCIKKCYWAGYLTVNRPKLTP